LKLGKILKNALIIGGQRPIWRLRTSLQNLFFKKDSHGLRNAGHHFSSLLSPFSRSGPQRELKKNRRATWKEKEIATLDERKMLTSFLVERIRTHIRIMSGFGCNSEKRFNNPLFLRNIATKARRWRQWNSLKTLTPI
jgi:hypothetical protein